MGWRQAAVRRAGEENGSARGREADSKVEEDSKTIGGEAKEHTFVSLG